VKKLIDADEACLSKCARGDRSCRDACGTELDQACATDPRLCEKVEACLLKCP
jgi:hypothetical protein